MIESFYKAFEDFIVEFSGRRLAGAVLLALVGLDGFAVLDRYSLYFIMGRLERAMGLLERVSSLDAGGHLNGKTDLVALRPAIIDETRRLVEPGPTLGTFAASTLALWKFGAGVAPWLFFTFAFLRNIGKDPSSWNGVLGALFVGMTFGFLGLFIPNGWATWAVLIGYTLGHFLFVVVGVLFWQARKKARLRQAEA
jgi:hypothetical protein